MNSRTSRMPLCSCGGVKFRPAQPASNRAGKRCYPVVCLACGKQQDVSKTTYALCKYMMTHEPSKAFLQLYQMES